MGQMYQTLLELKIAVAMSIGIAIFGMLGLAISAFINEYFADLTNRKGKDATKPQ